MFNVRSIVLLVLSYVVIPRLTFLPKNVHSVLIIFGPFLLPKLIELFNTARATSRSVPVRPTPPKVQNALNLLFVSAVVCLALSFANFAPENIFVKTSSHIRTETSVLFARLRHLRPLTPEDEALREKFMTRPSTKLQYLAWGPDTLLNCAWCVTPEGSEAHNYFLYSLPKIATPHIAHLAVLGLATSSLVGSEGSRFRTHATIAGLVLLVIEGWFFATYDVTTNKKARMVKDLDSVHWRLRFLRLMAFTITDIVLAAVLWATSTNRWLAKPISIAERLEMTTRGAEESLHRLRALGLLTNSVNRDPTLREMREMYWRIEGQITAETVQEEEVMEEINKVINKIDLRSLEGRAGEVADTILQNMDGMPATAQMKERGQLS